MRQDLLALYDAQMRREPPLTAGLCAANEGRLVRLSGLYDCIVYSDVSAVDVDGEIDRLVADLLTTGGGLEWKVHGHDQPSDLGIRLGRRGFKPDPAETLLIRTIDSEFLDLPAHDAVVIRAVSNESDSEAFRLATQAAFNAPFADTPDSLLARVHSGAISLHVAYLAGAPVAAGRLEMPPHRDFAGLYTGGVAPEYRGSGIYRALVRSRAREAASRGYRYLVTEAMETSRPILERLGFEALTTVQGWVFDVPSERQTGES